MILTVSVVSHGQGALAQRVLDDLAQCDGADQVHAVATLNIPEDWAPIFPGARLTVIRNPHPRGFGANHNAAFACCDTPYFAVLNPDLRISATDTFTRLQAAFADPRLAVCTPRILGPDGTPADVARALLTPGDLVLRRWRAPPPASLVTAAPCAAQDPPAWIAGMCLLFRSAAYRAVGGFNPRFFMYCEDFDICARLRLEDWKLRVVETASVVHEAQRASHRNFAHFRWHAVSLLRTWTSRVFWRYRQLLKSRRAA